MISEFELPEKGSLPTTILNKSYKLAKKKKIPI